MKIKTRNNAAIKFDIREWNDEEEAFIKPLNGFETLAFNDLFFDFYNKDNDPRARYNAAFDAALMCLVDANGAPIFTEDDRATVENASFVPFFRMFAARLEERSEEATAPTNDTETPETETAKKN